LVVAVVAAEEVVAVPVDAAVPAVPVVAAARDRSAAEVEVEPQPPYAAAEAGPVSPESSPTS
jgi:hypothetical protein